MMYWREYFRYSCVYPGSGRPSAASRSAPDALGGNCGEAKSLLDSICDSCEKEPPSEPRFRPLPLPFVLLPLPSPFASLWKDASGLASGIQPPHPMLPMEGSMNCSACEPVDQPPGTCIHGAYPHASCCGIIYAAACILGPGEAGKKLRTKCSDFMAHLISAP